MIVDGVRVSEQDGRAERHARVRWTDGDFDLWVAMPPEFAAGGDDASPFLCATLLLAMRRGEDLEIRGPVSPRLLDTVPRIVDLYAQWDPRLYRARVRAEPGPITGPRARGIGCFFSRGVDSLYSASVPRGLPGPLTHLVHCDRLEPLHSEAVRAEEVRLAGEAAGLIGIPLVVIETNLRELTDPLVRDWADMAGAGLAFLATAMAGGFGHVVIPSSAGQATVVPSGTSPMIDPAFSTDTVAIHHDVPATRPAKVAWLARERPDLLPHLKVCFYEDRPDNCGRCSKCLLTMLSLEVWGALGLATGFPPEVDPEAMAAIKVRGLQPSEEFRDVERALREQGRDDLCDMIDGALARGAAAPFDGGLRTDSPGFLMRLERHVKLGRLAARAADGPSPAASHARPAAPRVSVLIAAGGAPEEALREAVASVLAQTVEDVEVLLAGTGTAVDALGELADPRIRAIGGRPGRGAPAALNAALASSRAALVAPLGARDSWEPDYLAEVLPRFDDPGVGLVYTNAAIVEHPSGHENFNPDAALHPVDDFPRLAERNPVPPSTATMRTLAVRAAGGYASWLRSSHHHHLYMKLARAGWRFAYVDRRLARHRWPEAAHDGQSEERRLELWDHAMHGSFVARHPRTEGPRRQLRVRARREAELARRVAARGAPPEPPGGRPRLLVEPGSHAMLNLGDVAMLQVCVERLRHLCPDAAIGVVTTAPELLARHCPGTEAVPAAGQYEWFERSWDGGAYAAALGDGARARVERLARRLSAAGPRAARLALRAELTAREPASDELRAFAGWLVGADAIVMSGRGGTTDAFLEDGLQTLELMRLGHVLGVPTAMFSQGIGPIDEPRLRTRAGDVLPRVARIAVRERRVAVPLLEALGVEPGRVSLTGDDALEAAHRLRPAELAADGIGVGLRLSPYSGFDPHLALAAAGVLGELADERGGGLRALTISLYPHEADGDALRRLTGLNGPEPSSPREPIEEAGRCRVVVAGSYHSAVFALGQGVPVVALSATPYYDQKLHGLADMFPAGCAVIAARDRDAPDQLAAAVREAWDAGEARRPALLSAAEEQIAAAREAYRRFGAALGAEAAPQASGSDSSTEATSSSESASLYL